MTQASLTNSPLWNQIVGEDLSAVSFIRDYVRFEFNAPLMIDVLSTVTLTTPIGTAKFGDPTFATLALQMIGSVVQGVRIEPGETFAIDFIGWSSIQISLQSKDCIGPEAVVFHGRNQQFGII